MDDVRDHELVPEHVLLDDEEVEAVLEEYDIRRTDLPKIKEDDPALPDEASAAKGRTDDPDVVKIVRDSRTTDTANVYRVVIE